MFAQSDFALKKQFSLPLFVTLSNSVTLAQYKRTTTSNIITISKRDPNIPEEPDNSLDSFLKLVELNFISLKLFLT